ncbi:hypothetical protein CKO42_04420 [Lamprobacter modestohalophilus]|uniref:Acyltransferase 3 domain-containing protein n=1 Tax=Lamprobacter modestohalophilus TaxID=1064514 RepID=A0A9X0W655_9GAMM|nr:acyltransferase [Lamprobacter modestohalophilus]MBK1617709.1 hypothetical protein [Lamprobacter modestohalophilus]
MASRSTLQSIQALRAVAIFLVLLLHLVSLAAHYRPGDVAHVGWAGIGHAGVDLFFVISGFIMYLIGHRQSAGWSAAGRFLYRRAARVYLPYWLWFLVAFLVYLSAPQIMLLKPGQITDLFHSFLLIPTWTPQLLPVSWTLKYELYFYAVCAFILFLPGRYRLSAAGGWLLYMLTGQWVCSQPPMAPCEPALFLTMHPIMFEFAMGALVGFLYEQKTYLSWASRYLLGLGVLVLLAVFVVYVFFAIDLDANAWNRVVLFGLPAALIVFGATLAERDQQARVSPWLVAVGNASYSYYLSHLIVIQMVFWLLAPIAWFPTLLMMGIACAVSLLVARFGYRYAEQPLLRFGYRAFSRQPSGVSGQPS